MSVKKSITITQSMNPRFNPKASDPGIDEHAEWSYRVEKTTNTIDYAIGEYLTPRQVNIAINKDVTVNIVSVK